MHKDLCRPCAEAEKAKYAVKVISTGVNKKITCAVCGRRRYGATYEVGQKGAKR